MSDLIEILMVEDNPGDVVLTREIFESLKIGNALSAVRNGEEALAFLRRAEPYVSARRPDLILLDLNLPVMDGRELLRRLKADDDLRSIPVVVLTTSHLDEDVIRAYDLQAACYVTKPFDLDEFRKVVHAVSDFWFGIVKLPPRNVLAV